MKQPSFSRGVMLFMIISLFVMGTLGEYLIVQAQRGSGAGGRNFQVLVSRNGKDNAGEVGVFEAGFKTRVGMVKVGNNEGIAIDKQGDLYQCGDGAGGPSIKIFARFAERAKKDATFDPKYDREIKGAKTTLKNPKGLDLDTARGLIFVAENGNGTVLVFSAEAAGEVEPIATVTPPAKPWDVEYDDATDSLYVALVNGKVAVYDRFVFSGFDGTPERSIEPEGSVNLHGIVYDRAQDMLLLSDVGQATSNEDGKLFVVRQASKVYGVVKPARTIEGVKTKLGNPVDIVYDGKDLYVAEKANDVLLVYRNFALGPSGAIVADVIIDDIKPEALLLLTQ
ncbi:MAG: hypothetical protein AB1489_02390 [Acidobacteriota bacterium]